jgi:hypothetical protein
MKVSLHQLLDEVDLSKLLKRRRLGDVKNGDDLRRADQDIVDGCISEAVRTFSFTHASEKYLSSLSSRRVRRQKSECSNGRMRLIATCLPVGLCSAPTTVPYAPSPSELVIW